MIVPDRVLDEIGYEGSSKYHYIFELFDCEVIGRKASAELEATKTKTAERNTRSNGGIRATSQR